MTVPPRLSISVIIPAFNEEKRIPSTLEALYKWRTKLARVDIKEVVIVDDGSTDHTVSVINAFQNKTPSPIVLENRKNRGKGFSIRRGLCHSKMEWFLVADADMATPWEEIEKLAEVVTEKKAQIAIGSRDVDGSQLVVRQSIIRETLGKTFNTLVRFLTFLPFKDTQCGFKLLRRDAISSFMNELKVDRFAWDVEFLLRCREAELRIEEVPVRWSHQEESKVNLCSDGTEMLITVLILRLKFWARRIKTKWRFLFQL